MSWDLRFLAPSHLYQPDLSVLRVVAGLGQLSWLGYLGGDDAVPDGEVGRRGVYSQKEVPGLQTLHEVDETSHSLDLLRAWVGVVQDLLWNPGPGWATKCFMSFFNFKRPPGDV